MWAWMHDVCEHAQVVGEHEWVAALRPPLIQRATGENDGNLKECICISDWK